MNLLIFNALSWEQRKLGESLSFLKDGTHGTHADAVDGPLLLSAKNIKDGTVKWDESDRRISQEEYEKIHSNFSLKTGDVLLTIVGSIGEAAILKDYEGVTFQRSVAFLRPKDDILSDFLYTEIQTPTFQKELESRKSTSAQPGIYLGDLAEIPLQYSPSLDEQKKIGEYFSYLDNLITLHQSKAESWKNKKNRFLTISWEQRKLGDIADRVTEKNASLEVSETFTNSAEFGIISQRDFFDHDITNKENIGNYFIVRPEDFVYNPRISVTAPVGPINRNKLGRNGVMSPLYTVFRPHDVSNTYLEYFFKTSRWYAFMQFNGDSGARSDRFSIGTDLFYEMPIPAPSFNEQEKIGSFFANLSDLITLHHRKLNRTQICINRSFLYGSF